MGFAGIEITELGLNQIKTTLPPHWKSVRVLGAGPKRLEFINRKP